MTTSVFPLYKNTYTLPAYFAVVLLLSSLCFGNLKDHLYFTHDDEIQQDYPHLNADPAFFFSPDKATASVRPIDELVMWAAYAAWGNNPAFFHLLDTHNAEAVKYIAFLLFTTTRAFHLLVVAAHTLAAWLLARVVWRQGGSLILAGATGLLFWVNGTHFQAVHHISALDYPLALCCGLTTLLALGREAVIKLPIILPASLALGILAPPSIAVVWLLIFYLIWQRDNNLPNVLRAWYLSLRVLVFRLSRTERQSYAALTTRQLMVIL